MKKLRKISIFLAIITLIIISFNQSIVLSKENTNAKGATTLTELKTRKDASCIAMGVRGDKLAIVWIENDTNIYILETYNMQNKQLLKSKKLNYDSLPLEAINKCTVLKNGNVVITNDFETQALVYNWNLDYINTTKLNESIRDKIERKAKKNNMISENAIKYELYANDEYESEFFKNDVTAFYDETKYFYITEQFDAEMQLDCIDKKILTTTKKSTNKQLEMAVYDYDTQTSRKVKTPKFDDRLYSGGLNWRGFCSIFSSKF